MAPGRLGETRETEEGIQRSLREQRELCEARQRLITALVNRRSVIVRAAFARAIDKSEW